MDTFSDTVTADEDDSSNIEAISSCVFHDTCFLVLVDLGKAHVQVM